MGLIQMMFEETPGGEGAVRPLEEKQGPVASSGWKGDHWPSRGEKHTGSTWSSGFTWSLQNSVALSELA